MQLTAGDVVMVVVTVTGTQEGQYRQESYAKKMYAENLFGEVWGAIQTTTAVGLCGVIDLHERGLLPQTGFIRKEDIPFHEFMKHSFGTNPYAH